MTRAKRIALELLGPPLLGSAPFLLVMTGSALMKVVTKGGSRESLTEVLLLAGYVLFIAYMLTGIQSILYTRIMEWRFSRGLDPHSWRAVRISSLLGFASGAVVAVVYGFDRSVLLPVWLFWGGTGLMVGFFMGWLIRAWSAGGKTPEGSFL